MPNNPSSAQISKNIKSKTTHRKGQDTAHLLNALGPALVQEHMGALPSVGSPGAFQGTLSFFLG